MEQNNRTTFADVKAALINDTQPLKAAMITISPKELLEIEAAKAFSRFIAQKTYSVQRAALPEVSEMTGYDLDLLWIDTCGQVFYSGQIIGEFKTDYTNDEVNNKIIFNTTFTAL